ncbi:MAG: helicase-exonuclease AddAB subunit AddA [Oscillibacter sp.]|nr:helicase-exonuclease AddAB subunit AddA [Oscillibacter sp.]
MAVKLTQQQRAVVENRGGSLLVSAAAGSGKTKVLVERLFRYVEEEGCNIDQFLIITYTKAAAAELRSKIASELSARLASDPSNTRLKSQLLRVYRADIKTVDSFCTALLRENTHLLAKEGEAHALTPDFRVLDESEAALLKERVLARVLEEFYAGLDEGGRQLADTLGAGRDDRALAELVLEVYDKLQSHAYPERWLEENRALWHMEGKTFDETPYAEELLTQVRRKAGHWAAMLEQGAADTAWDEALAKGYGEKFRIAAEGFARLAVAEGWEQARQRMGDVEFPRLSTPKGRKDDPSVIKLKQVWESGKACAKSLSAMLEVSGEEAMEDLRAVAPAMEALLELAGAFQRAYRAEKLRLNGADFSDQEHLALELLVQPDGAPTPLGAQVAGRYVEILVDEYQDTNEIQNAIFRAVSRNGQNLFTVGDVKQSIYRFRLADPTIFLGKYNRFKSHEEAEEGEERKILLSKNFRSRREVLESANFIFENILSPEMGEMAYGEEEALHFGAEYYPARIDCQTEFHLISAHRKSGEEDAPVKRLTAEARFVARRIRQLLDEGYPVTDGEGLRFCEPEDIVILMRSPGSRAAAFAEALAERGIPCSFEEAGDFFSTPEISVAMALLSVVDNPRQDVPLISVLRSPVFGFTADRLALIRTADRDGDFYDALSADGGEDCKAFLALLEELRFAARDMSVYAFIWHIYNKLNLLGIFGAMEGGPQRRENLIAFSRHAEKFESSGYRGLFAFMTQLRRLIESGKAPDTKTASSCSGVRLMSIHKSKGLEFPVVILADLDHGFSRQDFDTSVLVHPTMGLGPRRVDLERKIKYPTLARLAVEEKLRRENLAEEQRLLYVAMTRPKEKLILVDSMYSAQHMLQKLCALASCPVMPEVVAEGKNFGHWILLPLLCRTEAQILRTLADASVDQLYISDTSQWQVFYHDGEDFREREKTAHTAGLGPEKEGEFDPSLLRFAYPYRAETLMPAKLTATQLKGRRLDEEIAEHAAHTPFIRPLSQPKFRREGHGLLPAEKGTATHLALQYLDLDRGDVDAQIAAMEARRLLTPQQAEAVDRRGLERFLTSPLAESIRKGRNVRREYRFTLLTDAALYDREVTAGDQVLLQGVVDCCFETEEGITVVDFKTDHVFTQEDLARRAEVYRPQLTAYSIALEQVLEKKVTRRCLYFIPAGKTLEV